MKRKLISLILSAVMAVSLVGCGGLVMMEQPQVRQQIRPPSQKVTMWTHLRARLLMMRSHSQSGVGIPLMWMQ